MVIPFKRQTDNLTNSMMNSIDHEQPENNYKDLLGKAGIQKIKELIASAKTCLFCTSIRTGKAFTTRPMSVQQVDDDGNLWFLSASDSHKNAEIASDDHVQLLFQGSSYSDFLTIYGQAFISEDKNKIKELWEPIIKDWFTEGVNDPRITVIKVEPLEGYYWDTKHVQIVGLVKRVVGAATGKTMDDSIEGKIKL
jgi:general stress protein 26